MGQVALVTGASSGIGRHLVEGLAARGVAVAGFARTGERLETAMAEVAGSTGARTLAVAADVTDQAAVDAAVARVADALREGAGHLLESLRLFDVYTGPPVPEGARSLAYALTLRAPDRTLTSEEADRAVAAITERLSSDFGATLRSG